MPNPFKKIVKNTEESKQLLYKKGVKTTSEVKTRICENCKAPRSIDTDLTTCDYCGFEFMSIDIEIKPDN